jgi:hypothetical protein
MYNKITLTPSEKDSILGCKKPIFWINFQHIEEETEESIHQVFSSDNERLVPIAKDRHKHLYIHPTSRYIYRQNITEEYEVINHSIVQLIYYAQQFESFFKAYDNQRIVDYGSLCQHLKLFTTFLHALVQNDYIGLYTHYWNDPLVPDVVGYLEETMEEFFQPIGEGEPPKELIDFILFQNISSFPNHEEFLDALQNQAKTLYTQYIQGQNSSISTITTNIKTHFFGNQQHLDNLQKLRDMGLSI